MNAILRISIINLMFVSALSSALSGCAAPVPKNFLIPRSDFNDIVPNVNYVNKIFIRNAHVNEDFSHASPAMRYVITGDDLHFALREGLRRSSYLSNRAEAVYYLDVSLDSVKVPGIGLNSTATATMNYALFTKDDSIDGLIEILTLPCTVTAAEMFDGDIRARMSVGCAVGENITHFIKTLERSGME